MVRQAEMNTIRSEEKALYTKNSAEMKQGIAGVQKALTARRGAWGGGARRGAWGDGTTGE